MQIQNDNTVSTTEVDTDGGYIIKHNTRTWDEYTRIDEAQANLDALNAQVAAVSTDVQAFNDALAQIQPITEPPIPEPPTDPVTPS